MFLNMYIQSSKPVLLMY